MEASALTHYDHSIRLCDYCKQPIYRRRGIKVQHPPVIPSHHNMVLRTPNTQPHHITHRSDTILNFDTWGPFPQLHHHLSTTDKCALRSAQAESRTWISPFASKRINPLGPPDQVARSSQPTKFTRREELSPPLGPLAQVARSMQPNTFTRREIFEFHTPP